MDTKLIRLREQLSARAKRRAEYFKAYACHNDNNATARRVLAGSSGNWYPRANGERVYRAESVPAQWRNLGDVHTICRNSDEISSRLIDHIGWYADSYQDARIIGRVLQLPARKGIPQYVPATYGTDHDGVTLYLGDICDSLRDAVMRADSCAESEAEQAREYAAQYQAESEIEQQRDDISAARRACLVLLREMRPARKSGIDTPAICAALRRSVGDYLGQIDAARKRIAALQDNYWLSVE